MKLTGQIQGGKLLVSDRVIELLTKKEGKYFTFEIDERESDEMRRFFEGAVIPYWFYQNPNSEYKDFAEARESLKLEFNGGFIHNIHGSIVQFGKSTAMNSSQFQAFLGRIQDYFMKNGYEWPDAEQFKQWRDLAPNPNEVYPPLLKLKEIYDRERLEKFPRRKKRIVPT